MTEKKKPEDRMDDASVRARLLMEEMEQAVVRIYGEETKKAAKEGVLEFIASMERQSLSYSKKSRKIVNDYMAKLKNLQKGELIETFNEAYEKEASKSPERYKDLIEGLKQGKESPLVDKDGNPPDIGGIRMSGFNNEKFQTLLTACDDDMDKATQAVLRKTDDVYRQAMFKTQTLYSGGALSLSQAVDEAANDFWAGGLNCIQYKNGRNINIASYAEMAVRTADQRAKFFGEGEWRESIGNYLVKVSSHWRTCELCAPWQGRILIDDVYSGDVPADFANKYDYQRLSNAIAQGFLHPNCRHNLMTWYDGVSKTHENRPLTKEEKEDAIKKYKAEQTQRAYERKIRLWRRKAIGCTDKDNRKEAEAKVSAYQAALEKHLQDNDYLQREPWRERPYLAKIQKRNRKK